MKTETTIVLLPVCDFDRKTDAEKIENQKFTLDQLRNTLVLPSYEIYNHSDFMDLCNDQELNIENYWVSYIQLIP